VGTAVTNQAPAATDDTVSVDANGSIVGFNVLSNDTDTNGDSLSVKAVSSVPGSDGGKFTLSTVGLLNFVPNSNFDRLTVADTKTTSFTYTVSDGKATDTGVITVTVKGIKAVAPTPSSGDVTVSQRGQRLDGGSETNTATVALGSKGIMVKAINAWSALGKELNLASDKVPAYMVMETGASAVVNGKTLPESYWTLFEDKESQTGLPLTGSALTTSLLFGTILTNYEKIAGTDTNDQMYGREANDYFITKKGSDYLDGGAGNDTARVLGKSTDYSMIQKGTNYELRSGLSTVTLSNMENVEFDDGTFTTSDVYNRLRTGAVLGASTSIKDVYSTQLQLLSLQLKALKQRLSIE
jgi:VCBS repeat-containing protein